MGRVEYLVFISVAIIAICMIGLAIGNIVLIALEENDPIPFLLLGGLGVWFLVFCAAAYYDKVKPLD